MRVRRALIGAAVTRPLAKRAMLGVRNQLKSFEFYAHKLRSVHCAQSPINLVFLGTMAQGAAPTSGIEHIDAESITRYLLMIRKAVL